MYVPKSSVSRLASVTRGPINKIWVPLYLQVQTSKSLIWSRFYIPRGIRVVMSEKYVADVPGVLREDAQGPYFATCCFYDTTISPQGTATRAGSQQNFETRVANGPAGFWLRGISVEHLESASSFG